MNCQIEPFWRKYIDKDSELGVSERGAADEHLKECRACQAKVTALGERMELVGFAFTDSSERPETAWDRFERERLITPETRRSFSLNTPLAAVVIVGVVLVGGLA